ncbi:sugar phosphate isomerase/epimerase family protein [Paenibacillus eucommiae]|uniref:Sugar phosphate isomerase/epimerase n=1 Tax=Paenibacillus eucommiae TaxID=1355755 RepID=A0ABS4J9P1_9BACL|nr:sugar phosphate isomerase/epimerase family protein [Paenibacillus eucommiae]MBP1996561.1 sugar phosphate isomerase/epimerase [Paenibacillus eucommiae]
MIKLACMSWVYANVSFEQALQRIAQAGYRYVSFGLPHEGKPAFDDSLQGEADRILRLLDRHGLQPLTLVSTDSLAPDQPLALALNRMEFAKALGVQELLSLGTWGYHQFPNEPRSGEEMKIVNDAFDEKFRLLGEEAGKRGLMISIKPHTGNTATGQVIAETLHRIGSPFVKACYDPGNVRFYEGIEPKEDVSAIAGQTISFVAKEHKGAQFESNFPIPGQGEVDFPAQFSILKAAGFDGPVIVERIDGQGESLTVEAFDERNAHARANLEAMLAEVGLDVS